MSEYELFDVAASYQGLSYSWIATFITVLTAYLIVAYTVGHRLSTFQSLVITASFVIFEGLSVYAAHSTAGICIELYEEIMLINPTRTFAMTRPVMGVATSVLSLGIVVAVLFMYDRRRS